MGVGIMGRRPATTIVQLQPSFSNPNKYRLNDAREDASRMLRLRKELFNLSPVEVTVRCIHSHQHTIVFKNGRLGFQAHDKADFQADKAFMRLAGEKIKAFRCHNVLLAWSGNRPYQGSSYTRLDYRIIPAAFRAAREKGREISGARWDVRRHLDHAAGNKLDVLSLPTEERKKFRLSIAVEKLLKGYEKELTYTLGRDKRGKKFFIVFKADTDSDDVSIYHWDTPKQGVEYQVSIPAIDFFRVHRKGLAIVEGMLAVKIVKKRGKNVVLTLLKQTVGTTIEWNPATKAWDRQVQVPDLETRRALVSPDKKVVKWL